MPVAWIVTVLPFAYAAFTVFFILVPGTTISVDRLTYELTQFIPLVFIVLLTIVFYIMGHNDKRNQDVFVEMDASEAGAERAGGIAGE